MLHRLSRVSRDLSLAGRILSRLSPAAATRRNHSSYTDSDGSDPTPMTNDPVVNKILETWPGDLRNRLNFICSIVKDNQVYRNEARIRFIDTQEWESYNFKFRRHLMVSPMVVFKNDSNAFIKFSEAMGKLPEIDTVKDVLEILTGSNSSDVETSNMYKMPKQYANEVEIIKKNIFDILISNAEKDLVDMRMAYKTFFNSSDLRVPHEWYPLARIMRRKIIFHGGPTNSGKTYHALQRLKEADPAKGGGVYCGPLRLLALEIFENLNRSGVHCNLLTGQEKHEVPGATHTSCTVEMINTKTEYDVAVIDEIQMIGNDQRGNGWTRALLGLRANEVHVCGGLEAYNIVKSLVDSIGDDFEFKKYDRLSTLNIANVSDCVVAFNRQDIFAIKHDIERLTSHKCAVIYGQLPPETRSMQARLFNDDNTGFDVLVASDAIGMGLNLNIRRIIFHTTKKRMGKKEIHWVDPSTVKQIGGRAGRLSSKYKQGEVTSWQDQDLAYIKAVMQWDVPQIKSAGISPSTEQIELFAEQLYSGENQINLQKESVNPLSSSPTDAPSDKAQPRLSVLLNRFVELSQMDGRYFLCDHQDIVLVANWLNPIPLSITDRFTFSLAPVNTRDIIAMHLLYQFAAQYAMNKPVALNVRLSQNRPRDFFELADLCSKHNVLDLYLWLSSRFPTYFIEREICLQQKAFAVNHIQETLQNARFAQSYSYSEEYEEMNKSILKLTPDGLPPSSHSEEVRQSTKENIDRIRKEDLYVGSFDAMMSDEPDGDARHDHGSRRNEHPLRGIRSSDEPRRNKQQMKD